MRAALRSLRRQKPRRLVMAVPVAPPDALDQFAAEADEVVILATPTWFYAIGQFYADFHQLADAEVTNLMKKAEAFGQTPKSGQTAG